MKLRSPLMLPGSVSILETDRAYKKTDFYLSCSKRKNFRKIKCLFYNYLEKVFFLEILKMGNL